jgi:hypothetical protein
MIIIIDGIHQRCGEEAKKALMYFVDHSPCMRVQRFVEDLSAKPPYPASGAETVPTVDHENSHGPSVFAEQIELVMDL